ncbi:hypothetical protein [Actinoplanes auranticolor]|uniref:Uncharacterized protein n=1 Tax=Actinoplanes auranticolor TaxID=47988 RepID=A0A919VWM3_9ACTN|nr:hypothetical protein [Actinoplanes auranticolor]GIM77755.1 hypothetical protein Aau02nite_77540 [Actinoplanes auranticolor]
MITSIDGRTTVALPAPVTVLPVVDGERPVGAWVVGPGGAAFRPVVDVTRLAGTVLAAVGAATVAVAVVAAAGRRRPEIGAVTMGPGGWVSIKRTALPPLRSAAPRPWWARVLRARRLVPQS